MGALPRYTEWALRDDEPGEPPVLDLDRPMAPAECDALASELLGRLAACEAEAARYRDAQDREIRRLTERYATLLGPVEQRARQYEAAVCELARRADFGTKRSRAVGNGTYGVRTVPERVAIVDPQQAVAWARAHCPGAVKTKITESVDHRGVAPAVLAQIHATGALPDGFSHESARAVPFAKPEVTP